MLRAPLAPYARLAKATPAARQNVRIIGGGTGLHWPDADEDLSVAGLLPPKRGRPAKGTVAVGSVSRAVKLTPAELAGLERVARSKNLTPHAAMKRAIAAWVRQNDA